MPLGIRENTTGKAGQKPWTGQLTGTLPPQEENLFDHMTAAEGQ